MNIYTQRFSALCAKNKRPVEYVLRIESIKTIMVEDIQDFVEDFENGYHEQFADDLYAKFGGIQTLDAHHHGTEIRTLRP